MHSPTQVNSYLEFARDMLPRIRNLGYNAIQLMAVQEHAYYGSFGYHVTNFFAVSCQTSLPGNRLRETSMCAKSRPLTMSWLSELCLGSQTICCASKPTQQLIFSRCVIHDQQDSSIGRLGGAACYAWELSR